MKWVTRGNLHLSSPYQIASGVRGHSLWIHRKNGYQLIARDVATLARAKELAAEHLAKQKEPA